MLGPELAGPEGGAGPGPGPGVFGPGVAGLAGPAGPGGPGELGPGLEGAGLESPGVLGPGEEGAGMEGTGTEGVGPVGSPGGVGFTQPGPCVAAPSSRSGQVKASRIRKGVRMSVLSSGVSKAAQLDAQVHQVTAPPKEESHSVRTRTPV